MKDSVREKLRTVPLVVFQNQIVKNRFGVPSHTLVRWKLVRRQG